MYLLWILIFFWIVRKNMRLPSSYQEYLPSWKQSILLSMFLNSWFCHLNCWLKDVDNLSIYLDIQTVWFSGMLFRSLHLAYLQVSRQILGYGYTLWFFPQVSVDDFTVNIDFFFYRVHCAIFSTHRCWQFRKGGKIKLFKIHFFRLNSIALCKTWMQLYLILSILLSKPRIHKRAEWFANHLRMICEPNARMCGWDCELALRHSQIVRIPFATKQNLSVFA